MTRLRTIATLSMLAAFAVGSGAVAGDKKSPLPYALAVRVVPGDHSSDELRRDVEKAIVMEIRDERCYAAVAPYDPEGEWAHDLVLAVQATEVRDELIYPQSMAQRNESQDLSDKLRVTAELDVSVDMILQLEDASTAVRWDSIRRTVRRNPRFHWEDPQELAREDMLRLLIRQVRTFACKPSAKKLDAAIAEARAGTAGTR